MMGSTEEIIHFLLVLIVNSFAILGLHYAFSYDYIMDGGKEKIVDKNFLWFVSFYAKKIFGRHWSKPIATCVVCMASIWSLPIYTYAYGIDLTQDNIIRYLIYIPSLAGINRITERWL